MAKGGKGRKGGGGGGGKTRKYSRDSNGRFASTGTGATARGGRLLTPKGNKRKTQTIEAGGRKGVLAKPKGLKPGSIKPKAVAAKPAPKPVAAAQTAKPKTQKERWAARAAMLSNAATKNDAKAKQLRDASDTTGNTAFNTQPGKIPGRARMNAAAERAFRLTKQAEQQRSRAANLKRMATTNKGDTAKARAAKAEQVKTSYGGIKKGQAIQSEHGEATVIKANAKTVTYQTKDGRTFRNRPYEFQTPKPVTLGSSKVVDGAKVARMAERLGAKSRAPKSSSSVKNANTVATRAKAVAFLKGEGGKFPNARAAFEAMASNVRNRQVLSTGKKAAKPAVKPGGKAGAADQKSGTVALSQVKRYNALDRARRKEKQTYSRELSTVTGSTDQRRASAAMPKANLASRKISRIESTMRKLSNSPNTPNVPVLPKAKKLASELQEGAISIVALRQQLRLLALLILFRVRAPHLNLLDADH